MSTNTEINPNLSRIWTTLIDDSPSTFTPEECEKYAQYDIRSVDKPCSGRYPVTIKKIINQPYEYRYLSFGALIDIYNHPKLKLTNKYTLQSYVPEIKAHNNALMALSSPSHVDSGGSTPIKKWSVLGFLTKVTLAVSLVAAAVLVTLFFATSLPISVTMLSGGLIVSGSVAGASLLTFVMIRP